MISAISNPTTLSAEVALNRNRAGQNVSLQRLATGKRINTGKDDPADLISSEQLSMELKSLLAETKSLRREETTANIADGHAGELSNLMGDLNALVVASANEAGLTDAERDANQMQIDHTAARVQHVANDALAVIEGFNMPDDEREDIELLIGDAAAAVASIATGGGNSLATGKLKAALAAAQAAIQDVATARGSLGAYQKDTVEPRIRSAQIAIENLTDSRSSIRDTDFAAESSRLTRATILTETSIQVLEIAQQRPMDVLSLLT